MPKKYPSYLNITEKELDKRIKKAYKILEKCAICPRKCGANRLKNERGFCRAGENPIVSAYHPHFGEERVLVSPSQVLSGKIWEGKGGSGTIFFTHCNLACVYCQNYDISQLGRGNEVSLERLAEMMIDLQAQGCHNINFVSPTPYVPQILSGLKIAIKNGLDIPLVYNTNSYDSVETLKMLDGIIDIYLPDTKYADDKIALKYSNAPIFYSHGPFRMPRGQAKRGRGLGYSHAMKAAIKEMFRQVGDLEIDEQGIARRGLLVRHLVLPGGLAGTKEIMKFIAKEISPNTFVNVMNQYHPCYKAEQYPPLDKPLSFSEHQEAVKIAKKAGLKRVYS